MAPYGRKDYSWIAFVRHRTHDTNTLSNPSVGRWGERQGNDTASRWTIKGWLSTNSTRFGFRSCSRHQAIAKEEPEMRILGEKDNSLSYFLLESIIVIRAREEDESQSQPICCRISPTHVRCNESGLVAAFL